MKETLLELLRFEIEVINKQIDYLISSFGSYELREINIKILQLKRDMYQAKIDELSKPHLPYEKSQDKRLGGYTC
jgi:hypothetical protein